MKTKCQSDVYKVCRKGTFFDKLKEYKILLLMLMPVFIYYIVFRYVPMVGAILAFKKYDFSLGMFKSPWCGWDNFKFFFNSGQAWTVTKNTVLYNAAFISVDTVLQLFVAIFISEITIKSYKRITQGIMLMPHFISWVVVGTFVYNIFSYDYGILNAILKFFGKEPINAYTEVGMWKYILVAFNAWKSVGYGSVVYLAAIMGIDSEMYEAATIDGAGIWRRTFSVTIPTLVPTVITLTLLSIGRIFRGNFQLFYQIIGENGLLYNATDVIDTFAFRALMRSSEYGMSAAVGLYQSVMCFVLIVVVNAVVKKIDSDSALF